MLETTATGTKMGHVPLYRLRVLVEGPGDAYEATVEKLLHADEVQTIVGRSIGLRVHPGDPTDLILDD